MGLFKNIDIHLIISIFVFVSIFTVSRYFYSTVSSNTQYINSIQHDNILLDPNSQFYIYQQQQLRNSLNHVEADYNNKNVNNKKQNPNIFDVDANTVIRHTERLIEIGNSKLVYEESRALARDYIKEYLITHGVPSENIIFNRFEWSERKAEGKNITTTTWTGINIMVWSNSTAVTSKKIRVIGAHYDTVHWGLNRTSGAHDNLSGTGLVIETAIQFYKYNQFLAKQQPTATGGSYEETPYLFVLFDQEEPGALGSKSFIDHYKIKKNASKYAYFIDVDAIGYKNALPIIQTYPYEHNHQTLFSPRWLVDRMIQSAYQVTLDGISVGNPKIGLSLMYQAHRYHLLSISYLSDDGPFTWSGIDSLLLTDLDIFYGKNPDYHKPTDLPNNLDADHIKTTSNILSHFLLSTISDYSLPTINQNNNNNNNINNINNNNNNNEKNINNNNNNNNNNINNNYSTLPPSQQSIWNSPILRLFYQLLSSLKDLLFSGNKQYLSIGPICLGFFDLISISLLLLSIIYYTSFKSYREIVLQYEKLRYQKRKRLYRKSKNDASSAMGTDQESASEVEDLDISVDSLTNENSSTNTNTNNTPLVATVVETSSLSASTKSFFDSVRGHRILFVHLLTLSIIVLIDTVYCFEIICLGFLALTTIHWHKYNINMITSFISGAFCTNFIYKDISQMIALGRKGTGSQELSLGIFLAIYIIHSILIVIYGYDLGKKKVELIKYNNEKTKTL